MTEEKITKGREEKKTEQEKKNKISKSCEDNQCPVHGRLRARGRNFQGIVIRKFPRRITIEFERTIYVRKYERHMKKKTRIHARLPDCMQESIQIGDYVEIKECRPLSKIICFVVVKKIKSAAGERK